MVSLRKTRDDHPNWHVRLSRSLNKTTDLATMSRLIMCCDQVAPVSSSTPPRNHRERENREFVEACRGRPSSGTLDLPLSTLPLRSQYPTGLFQLSNINRAITIYFGDFRHFRWFVLDHHATRTLSYRGQTPRKLLDGLSYIITCSTNAPSINITFITRQ